MYIICLLTVKRLCCAVGVSLLVLDVGFAALKQSGMGIVRVVKKDLSSRLGAVRQLCGGGPLCRGPYSKDPSA